MQYATLLLVLLIAEVTIVVLMYTHQEELKSLMKDGLKTSMGDYEKNAEVKEAWDLMQSNVSIHYSD